MPGSCIPYKQSGPHTRASVCIRAWKLSTVPLFFMFRMQGACQSPAPSQADADPQAPLGM